MQKNTGWFMMDNRGNFTLEIMVVLIIIILILGIIAFSTESSLEKISNNVENNNIEKTVNEIADNLINNPGVPNNWEEYKPNTIGLAIVNNENNTIPNSVSYYKIIKLGKDYNNLVKKRLFNDKYESSMELRPYGTSISSVKIGSDEKAGNVYSVNRIVKCDFFKKYVIDDFQIPGKCNQNHDLKEYSCNYLKIFNKNLKSSDYYLLFDESEKNNIEYSIDTTHFKSKEMKPVTNTKIHLNDELKSTFEMNESSSIVFIHMNKKNAKAVLISVPKDFDRSKLNYNYFTTQTCEFTIRVWN